MSSAVIRCPASWVQTRNETVRHLIRELRGHHGDMDVDDDAVAVVIDWSG